MKNMRIAILKRIFFSILVCFVVVGCNREQTQDVSGSEVNEKFTVGFFSPENVDKYVPYVGYSVLNVYPTRNKDDELVVDLDRLSSNFEYVRGYPHRINLDLGPVITDVVPAEALDRSYIKKDGAVATKYFAALENNKLRQLVSDDLLAKRLEGLPELVKQYRENVGFILVVDEPYLNGVPPEEIDRVIRKLKTLFLEKEISDLEYGVIFASALFNSEYASYINAAMMGYVQGIDEYYKANEHLLGVDSEDATGFNRWVKAIESFRLTTYDSANNMYTGGGLPLEVDVVGFDFYLSTTLFDLIHENTLNYFYSIGMKECATFNGVSMKDVKRDLSFVNDGPMVGDDSSIVLDKQLLDEVFRCRMYSAMNLLTMELGKLDRPPKVFMIGESSANGVFEYDNQGRIEQNQPNLLVEQRIYHEVERSHQFYIDNADVFNAGLYFFLYPDAYDQSINLQISGAESAESVLNYIYRIASTSANDSGAPKSLESFEKWKELSGAN